MIMIGNRDDIVRTKAGYAVGFKAGQETYVVDDPYVIKECTDRGHTVKKEAKAAPTGKGVKFIPSE